MRRTRVLVIACMALALAILAVAGSALQAGLTIGEALAQSSVRPPDNAVNVAPAQGTAPGGAEIVLPGGSVRPPADTAIPVPTQPGVTREGTLAPTAGAEAGLGPLGTRGPNSDSDLWGFLRQGGQGTVSIPDRRAGVLVQDDGMGWLSWRNAGGPLQTWGGYAMLGMIALLALFFLVRGRIRIEHGKSGVTIERFKGYERFAHWLLAVSFILLALSGLNLLYGKDLMVALFAPVDDGQAGVIVGGVERWGWGLMGEGGYERSKGAFATLTVAGKWVHNNIAWAFMLALVMVFVLWVAHNIPGRADVMWLLRGGGLFKKGSHPPAPKFNAGQKIVFWSVILTGLSISLSGISLLFPYQAPIFAKTFVILNDIGLSELVMGAPLATELTAVQEMQYAQIWHTIVAFAMIVIIIAHIYIGTIGMEGAFDAMGSGHVDRTWAEEHHSLWVAEQDGRHRHAGHGAATPAE